MIFQSPLMEPWYASKKKQVSKRLLPQVPKIPLPLDPRIVMRRSHKRKLKLKVVSMQEGPMNRKQMQAPVTSLRKKKSTVPQPMSK